MDLGSLYRDLVETSPDGIWVIDTDGRTKYANRRLAQMLGRDPAELDESFTAFDVLDETGRPQMAAHLEQVRQGRLNRGEVECQFLRSDGTAFWVMLHESPVYDADGRVWGILHRITDYTDRRQMVAELRTSRAQLADAQRIAKVGSWEWDVVDDVITASEQLFRMFDVSTAGFDGRYDSFLALVHPDDRDAVDAAVRAALSDGGEFEFDARIVRGDGATVWTRGRGVALRDATGAVTAMAGTHQDVTETKQAELALQDLLAQNTLLQAMATAANEAESFGEALRVAQSLLLYHDDWVRGRAFLPDPGAPATLVPHHVSDEDREEDRRDAATSAFELGLATRALVAGQQVWEEERLPDRPSIAFPVMLEDQVVAIVVITACARFERHAMIRAMIDQVAVQLARVAERERAARELADARDAAMAASRQKSEFLATMSHEIRTPLNGVIGLNDLLLRTALDHHQQRLASGVQVASRALLGVINDILDFSKIEAGRLELEHVDFEVGVVFDQVASLLGESARGKGVELLVSCHPDVPDRLNGDPTRLAQVVTNLGSNAVKFTDEGEVYIRASVDASDPGPGTLLRVEVSDTGIGIEPQHLTTIFDVFSQADASTTRRYGGTGLGLAISREIVSALGGTIGVESVVGRGSRFWFTARYDAPTERGGAGAGAVALDGVRALVVDDNAHNRQILCEQLGGWGARTTTADGADRALRLLRGGERFEVVLLDAAMPGCDGLELARTMREEGVAEGASLVMLTSTSEPLTDDLDRAGIAFCLTKPVLAGDLRAALGSLLAGVPEPTPRQVEPAPQDRARPIVLVVEDNQVNQMVALGILESLGYAAHTADDGAEAVAVWRRAPYDAILMDVQMPRMDGYATTRAIRSAERPGARVPILAMTAAAVEGEREKCLAAGMDDFLTKPVDPGALAAMLRRWVAGHATGDVPEARSDGAPDAQNGGAAGGTAQPVPAVLDLDRLDMLRDLDPGNTTYLDRAIGNFVTAAPEALGAIRSAVDADDHAALTYAAHRLKGSAQNLGLPRVGDLAHQLELLGDAGTSVGAASTLGGLAAALAEAVVAVRAYQDTYTSG